MTARPRKTISVWEMWSLSGMLEMKKKGNMVSLKTYGRGTKKIFPSKEIILSCWKKWMEEIIQEGQSMVGFSSTIMSKKVLKIHHHCIY